MKAKFVCLGLFVCALALAAQDSFKYNRIYKVGDKDKYAFKMAIETSMGSVDISMTISSAVIKTYEDGSADIESATSEMKILFGGQEMPAGPQGSQKTVRKLDKYGRPVGKAPEGRGAMGGMDFSRFASVFADKVLTVGQPVVIDNEDAGTKQKVVGTVKLESVAEGRAKILANLDVTLAPAAAGSPPMKLVLTSWIGTADSKLVKSEGTASNLPSQQGMEIKAAQFSYTRIEG